MSHWVLLHDPQTGEIMPVESFTDGGTHAIGGTEQADFNITYNYGKHIHEALGAGVRDLDGQRAGDWIAHLERAVAQLGTARDPDYWRPTPGNVGAALGRLLGWARQHPDAIFRVS